jgi:hypothetical protein
MARPRKAPEEQRTRVLSVRLTAAEYDQVVAMARDAGMLPGPYARTTILDKRPRSKPMANLAFQRLVYELQSVSTNFKQLADATGDERYLKWARHVGGHLVEILIGRDDLADLMDQQTGPLNEAGQLVNALAYAANAGKAVSAENARHAIREIRAALRPLEEAAEQPPAPKE